MNSYIQNLMTEMSREAVSTQKILNSIPEEKYDWKPHPKSMDIRALAGHIVDIPSWIELIIQTDEIDFGATDFTPKPISNNADLIAILNTSVEKGLKALETVDADKLNDIWTMRNGETIIDKSSKADNIRHSYCQIVHHRAQLGVYLRLLNIPLPGVYGPSADEVNM